MSQYSQFQPKNVQEDSNYICLRGEKPELRQYRPGYQQYLRLYYGIGSTQPLEIPQIQIKYVEGGHAFYLEHQAGLYASIAPFLKKW